MNPLSGSNTAAAKQQQQSKDDFSFLYKTNVFPHDLFLQTVAAFHDDNYCFSSTYHGGKFGCKTIPSSLLSQE
jgi:hypothetical protein